MLSVLGDLVPYAVPVALSPLPIIAVVMLLLAPAGTAGALAFLGGRVVTLAVATLAFAVLASQAVPRGGEGGGVPRILIGCLVILAAAWVWHRRPRAGEVVEPAGWMRSIDRMTTAGALRFGALLTVANVKEVAFAAGAGMMLGAIALPPGQMLGLAAIFAGLAGLGVAAPVVWVMTAGDRSRDGLAGARDWLVRNNAIVMAAVMLAVGAMLIGSGLEAV